MFQSQFVITEQCNLACKYCYMNNRSAVMTAETFNNAYEFIEKKIKPTVEIRNQKTHIAFFGGEPLLNYKLIETVSPLYKDISKAMPTNGLLLTEEKYNFLNKNNVGLGLSFDGKIGNTINRVKKIDNKESFSEYNDFHYSVMRRHGCKVMLSPNMFSHLIEIYNSFFQYGIMFPDFTLVRDDIYTENDIKIYSENLKKLTNEVLNRYKKEKILAIPGIYSLYILDTIIASKTKQKRPFGCFAGTHGVGIMPNGKIYPCARFGSDNKFEIADINTNIINYDVINFFKNIYNPQEYPECKKCKLYMICNAGCSYSQLKNGNWERMKPVESVCELLKISYRESFKLYTELKNEKEFIDYLNHRIKISG